MSLLRTLAAALLVAAPAAVLADGSVDLTPWADFGSEPIAVTAALQLSGQVTGEGAKTPMAVSARLEVAYTQDELPGAAPGSMRVVRRIDRTTGHLRDAARLLTAETDAAGAQVIAVAGPLSRQELDQVQLPADPLDVDGLLPGGVVRDGGTWKVEPAAIDRLMRLRSDEVCDVVGIVSDLTPTHARLRFAGPVHGLIDGAKVEIDLRGVALFDRQQGRLTRLNLAWKESRNVGPATPAVEATAKLNLSIGPVSAAPIGAQERELAASAKPDDRLLVSACGGDWNLLASRDWFVVADGRQATTLRRVADGRVAAITTLTGASRRTLSVEDFEREVRYALGDSLTQVVSTRVTPDDRDVQWMAIASVGKSDGQPVEWRHHHLHAAEASLAATTTLPVDGEGAADDAAISKLIESIQPAHAGSETTAAGTATAVRR